jgi:starch-binding outer membrane protein, SusD/RagB family
MAYTQEGYRFIKSEIVAGSAGTYGNDVAFYRLADAMFIKAECLLRLGQDEQTAANLITEVRGRSFNNPADAVRTIADLKGGSVYPYGHQEYTSVGYNNWSTLVETHEGGDDIILGGLLDDLAWEFVGEHHRRQDLIRFKMTDGRNVFNGKSWFCKDATTETKYNYFPIPKMALDANLNLKQHEAYK